MEYEKGFDLDLSFGMFHEKHVEDILRGTKIEVKTHRDKWQDDYVAIEYRSRGYDSGILTTTADYWILSKEEKKPTLLFVDTEKVKKVIPFYLMVKDKLLLF